MPIIWGTSKVKLSQLVIDGALDMQHHDILNVKALHGEKEIISVEEILTKQHLKPTTPDAEALIVFDTDGVTKRFRVTEEGEVTAKEVTIG